MSLFSQYAVVGSQQVLQCDYYINLAYNIFATSSYLNNNDDQVGDCKIAVNCNCGGQVEHSMG